ncbi:MAG: hypothetical protein CO108_07750 [Deltaproteobacteria bacterium CG_4_9_14_3_um_filter_63_12]|nr:MAG: hypothetical protein CO108_07750 [Deltaproteobacteria bacterium CG_4_9_14_3_um_filter_63_12]
MHTTQTALLALCLATALLLPARLEATTICLDPGHGGTDPGATGCGLIEEEINLDTQLKLRSLLQAAGFVVIMTREIDVSVGLTARASYANSNGADRFVSIHSNSATNATATGIETYCSTTGSNSSFDLRDRIQTEMLAAWPLTNRGGKTASFTVLTATAMPATLSELAFIVNCGLDATYLGSNTERQKAAEAHLRALQLHFGQNPVDPPVTGQLKGVVFEDQGVGTADMSVLIPSTRVEIVETGDSQNAGSATAAWTFSLPPGTYTVRASRSGWVTNTRTCQVLPNDITWCSIGLFPDSAPVDVLADAASDVGADVVPTDTEPADTSVTDTNIPTDTGVGPDTAANDTSPPTDTASAPDLTTEDSTMAADTLATELAPRGNVDDSCGCRVGERSQQPPWLVLLLALGVLLFLRRRRLAAVGAALLVGFAFVPTGHADEAVVENVQFASLRSPKLVVEGHQSPVLSPSGEKVVYTTEKFEGLFVSNVDGSGAQTITHDARAGYLPVWTADSQNIALRLPKRPFAGEPMLLMSLNGEFVGPWTPNAERTVFQRDDAVWLREGTDETRLSDENDRYFEPQLSFDGQVVIYNGLLSGVHVMFLTTNIHASFAGGSHASLSADGRWLIFDRTTDDGEQVTGSELLLADLLDPNRVRLCVLTHSPDVIELYPSLSADGQTVTYSTPDGVWFAEVIEIQP